MFAEYVIEYTEDMVYVNGVTEEGFWLELWNEEIEDPYDFALGIGNALHKVYGVPVDLVEVETIETDEEVEVE